MKTTQKDIRETLNDLQVLVDEAELCMTESAVGYNRAILKGKNKKADRFGRDWDLYSGVANRACKMIDFIRASNF